MEIIFEILLNVVMSIHRHVKNYFHITLVLHIVRSCLHGHEYEFVNLAIDIWLS